MEDFIVRLATPRDAECIAKIHVEAWRNAYVAVMPTAFLEKLSVTKNSVEWAQRLANQHKQGAKTLVAECQGEIHGWLTYGPSRDADAKGRGEILALNLHPDFFGEGAGQSLMLAAEKALVDMGIGEWTLWVVEDNPRARRFYAKCGYLPDGTGKYISIGGEEIYELRYSKLSTQ